MASHEATFNIGKEHSGVQRAMHRRHWIAYVWPGLPQLLQGSWSGLGWAVLAAGLLQVALLTTWVWTEWIPGSAKLALWGGIILLWSGAVLASSSFWTVRTPSKEETSPRSDTLFAEAIDFYLQAQWFEAEKILIRLLRQNPRDVEARLMIATLFRHTHRWDEALRQLEQLERLEASRAWALEIQRERQQIAQAQAELVQTASSAGLQGAASPSEAEGTEPLASEAA